MSAFWDAMYSRYFTTKGPHRMYAFVEDCHDLAQRLAIIPGYSHYNFGTAPELGVGIEKFLDDPMTKPQGGEAAAASKVS